MTNKGPYYLADDAPKAEQRLTYEIFGLAFIFPVIIYIAWHIIKNVRLRILEHGKYSFLWFYLCIESSFVLRLLYCFNNSFSFGPRIFEFPYVIYGVWCYFPPVLTTTASLFFLISMLSSLDEVYQTSKLQKFGSLKTLVLLCIALFWTLTVAMYAALAYTDVTAGLKDNVWVALFFYTCAGGNIAVCVILIVVTIYYLKELRNFTYTYNDKKVVIFTMLGGTILQLSLRVFQSVLNGTGVMSRWIQICNDNDSILFHLYTCGYFLFSDVTPAIGYVLFLRKDVQAQDSLDAAAKDGKDTEGINSSITQGNVDVAGLLERLYKKKEAQRGKAVALVQSNYDGNSLTSQGEIK